MQTTIFKAYPGGTSGTTSGSLYAELKRPENGTSRAALYFQRFSGLYITSAMSVKRVIFEFRAGFSGSNEGTFTFQTSGGTTVAEIKTIDNNTGKNLYYRADYESYPDSNILPPWEGLVNSNLSSLLANNFTLYFCCLDAEYNTVASQIWKYNSSASGYNTNEWKCTVEWEYIPTSATLPTSLGTSSSASSLVTSYSGYGTKTLYWSGATGGQNSNGVSQSPSGYEISGGHLGSSVYSTNLTYYTFNFPENLNGTYIYYLKTISKNGEEYDSESLPIILTTYYSNPGTPTNIKINNVTDAYIGTEGSPVIKLTWDPPNNSGDNNSVASYTIYFNDDVKKVEGITQTSYQLETLQIEEGRYAIQAIGSISDTASSISNTVTLNYIGVPSAPLDNDTNISSVNSPTLSWNAAEKGSGVKSISYFIQEGETLIYSGEGTSFYYDYDEHFNDDKSTANLSIFTRAYAKDGGYTQSSSKTITVTKISNFSIPSGFWNSIPALFYSSTTVSWNKIDEYPNLEDRSPFRYELFFRSSSTGSWSNKGDVSENENAEFVLDATTIPEGNTIGYYMLITDKYGLSATSEIIETTKIIRPSVRNLQVTTNEQTFTSTFILQSNLAETAVKYKIYLHFPEEDNEEGKSEGPLTDVLSENYSATGSSIISSHEVDLNTLQEKLTINSKCYEDLYAKIITNHYSKPTVSYTVKAWYEDFEDAITEAESSSFQIDYAIAPQAEGEIVITENDKTVYNPEDIIQLDISGFKLKESEESLEGASAQSIEHKFISNYSKKSYSKNTDITIPSVNTDTNIGFYHVTTITYADAIKTYTNNVSCIIQVARWVKENIILESMIKSGTNEYTGYIILPEQLCSSLELKNLQKIDLSANAEGAEEPIINFYLDNSSNNTTTISGDDLRASTTKKIKVGLSTASTSFNFTTTITWTNTSNKSFSTSTITFSYHEAAADFAIRKQRAGINVGDNFTGVHNELGESAATFEINHGTGMGNRPIVSITNNSVTGYIKTGDSKLILEGFELDTLPIASSSIFGVIKVGSGLNINDDGVLSASAQNYTLPIATGSTLGGVKIGSGISIDNEGVISVETQEYQLPIAANGVLGGVTTTSTVTNSQGYVACPIINGVVYSPQIPVLSVNEKSGEVVLTAEDLSGFSDVAISGDYNDLINKPTIPTVNYPVTSVNGKSGGAITLTYLDVEAAYKNHTHDIDELNGVATFRLAGTTLYITTNTLAG